MNANSVNKNKEPIDYEMHILWNTWRLIEYNIS